MSVSTPGLLKVCPLGSNVTLNELLLKVKLKQKTKLPVVHVVAARAVASGARARAPATTAALNSFLDIPDSPEEVTERQCSPIHVHDQKAQAHQTGTNDRLLHLRQRAWLNARLPNSSQCEWYIGGEQQQHSETEHR